MDIHGVRSHVRGMVADGRISSEEQSTLGSWGITGEQVERLKRNLVDGGGLTDPELIAVIHSTNTTLTASVGAVAAPTNPAKLAPPTGGTAAPAESKTKDARPGGTAPGSAAPKASDPIAELAIRQRRAASDAFQDGALSTGERTALQGLEISTAQIERLQQLARHGGGLTASEAMSVLSTGAIRDRRADLERAKAREATNDERAGYLRPGVSEAFDRARSTPTGRRILDELDRRNIPIKVISDAELQRRHPGSGGFYEPTKREIVIPRSALERSDRLVAVLVHEARHALDFAGTPRARRNGDFSIDSEVRAYLDQARILLELGLSVDQARGPGGLAFHPTEDRLLSRAELEAKIRSHPLYDDH